MFRNDFSRKIMIIQMSIVDIVQAEICVCYRKGSFRLFISSNLTKQKKIQFVSWNVKK